MGQVVELREQLKVEAGIKGLEVIDPAEEGFALKAARVFWRDGFVVQRISPPVSR